MWVHVLPGRVRARVPGLKGSVRMGTVVAERLAGCSGVRAVTVSPATGTALILYDPAVIHLRDVERLLLLPPADEVAATGEAAAVAPAAVAGEATLGLTTADVRRLQAARGRNELREPPRPSFLSRLADQYRDTMQLTLWAGAGLSLLAGNRGDGLTMAAVLLLNGMLGASQAGHGSQAFEALRAMGERPSRVVRGGVAAVVPASDLVPGDLLLVEAGERVPADAVVMDAAGLALDESHLTGEPFAVEKGSAGDTLPAGSLVVRGRGRAVVSATGMDSSLGRIARLLEVGERPGALQRQMDGLGRRMARLGFVLAAGVAGLGVLRGQGAVPSLLSGVSLAISAVPEGLPAFVTLALVAGARRTGRQNGTFRHLAAVERMGAVTALCCDKTGTLTQGEMAVREIQLPGAAWAVTGAGYCPEGEFRRDGRAADPLSDPSLRRLLKVAALCTTARIGVDQQGRLVTHGDPTEIALLIAALKAGLRASGGEGERLHELAFDAQRRRMAVLCGDGPGRAVVCAKGAPEAMLPLCTHLLSEGAVRRLDVRARRGMDRAAAAMAGRGLRVLTVAYRSASPALRPEGIERELVLLGLVGMADPPRPEAAGTVSACRAAGIRVIMLTGDHPATASAIAGQVGIEGDVLTGAQLARMSDAEVAAAVAGLGVVARAVPEQKLRIVRALRQTGQVVAMTGDGVNDAPAMREADVGIAMGDRGTEVARATAGLVLEDDSLATVVAAVEQGRATRANVGRMARYLLGSNAAEVCLMGAALLLGLPLPLLPVHLLWLNLAGDALPAAALGDEPPEPGTLRRPPQPGEAVLGPAFRGQVLGHGLRAGLGATALYAWALGAGRSLPSARSLAMVALAAAQVRHLDACRSRQQTPQVRRARAATAALTLAAVYFPPLRGALGLAPLALTDLALAAGTAAITSGMKEDPLALRGSR